MLPKQNKYKHIPKRYKQYNSTSQPQSAKLKTTNKKTIQNQIIQPTPHKLNDNVPK